LLTVCPRRGPKQPSPCPPCHVSQSDVSRRPNPLLQCRGPFPPSPPRCAAASQVHAVLLAARVVDLLAVQLQRVVHHGPVVGQRLPAGPQLEVRLTVQLLEVELVGLDGGLLAVCEGLLHLAPAREVLQLALDRDIGARVVVLGGLGPADLVDQPDDRLLHVYSGVVLVLDHGGPQGDVCLHVPEGRVERQQLRLIPLEVLQEIGGDAFRRGGVVGVESFFSQPKKKRAKTSTFIVVYL